MHEPESHPATIATTGHDGPAGGDLEDQRPVASVHGRLFDGDDQATLGRYRLGERLGAGAMGEVFLGHDDDLDRPVAIKLVHAELADARRTERMRREAKALARLAHPHVVRVYEVGMHQGRVFLAMEYVRGRDLRTWIANERPPWHEVLGAYLQAGRGLAAAHQAGLTHRDFKPDNVLRRHDGHILVADFGLVRFDEGPGSEREEPTTEPQMSLAEVMLSRTGEVKGTPVYMPPEQLSGQAVDARADQFAFCVALYEGLWGQRPFIESTLQVRILAIKDGPQPPPDLGAVPSQVWPIVARGLGCDPEDRWPSMEPLLAALEDAVERPRRRRRRAALGLALGLTAGAAGILGATVWSSAPCEAMSRELAGAWTEDDRRAIERAFAATGPGDGQRAIEALGAWGRRWVDTQVELCESGQQERDPLRLAQRSACLEQRRRHFEAMVDVLGRASATAVQQGLAAVSQLDPPEGCIDGPALRFVPPAPPEAQRGAVDTLDRTLDRAEALVLTAQHAEALEQLAAIEAEVERTEHDPLQARWSALRGRALLWGQGRRDHDQGVAALLRAADLAEGSGHDLLLASAWQFLALHATTEARDAKRGERWLRRAHASARRVGIDPDHAGELAKIRGHQSMLVGQPERAEQEFRAAIADLTERGQTYRRVDARLGLGNALIEQGRLDEAVQELRLALTEAEPSYGPRHPIHGTIHYNIVAALLGLGRSDEARASLGAAIEVWTAAHAEPHPELGAAHVLRASLLLGEGDLPGAEAEVDAAQRVVRATRPPDHPEHGDVASARAAVAFARGDFVRAREALDEVISIYRREFGADDIYLAKVTAERGWASIALGDVEAAARDLAAADEVLRADEQLAAMRAKSLLGLAVVATSQGRPRDALAWLERVHTESLAPADLAAHQLWRAVVRWRLGDAAAAREALAGGEDAVAEALRTGSLSAAGVTAEELDAIRNLEQPTASRGDSRGESSKP